MWLEVYMSGFEFVLVLYAVIAGLAISELVTGFADQISARHRMAFYPLQILLSIFLLYASVVFLWTLWMFRAMDWSFQLYLLIMLYPLIIALCSRLVRIDYSAGAMPVKDQYFSNAAPTYIALALIPTIVVVLSFTSLREIVEDPPDLAYVTPFRVLAILGFLFLAWSKNETAHKIGLLALNIFVVIISSRLSVDAIGGAT